MDMTAYFLGRIAAQSSGAGSIVEKESATATLTLVPNFKGTAAIEPTGSIEIMEE